jgi:hypothetical protein
MAKHNTIVPKKRGRPVGSKNTPKYNPNVGPSTITSSSRALLEIVRSDLSKKSGYAVSLRETIQYLVESYVTGDFK